MRIAQNLPIRLALVGCLSLAAGLPALAGDIKNMSVDQLRATVVAQRNEIDRLMGIDVKVAAATSDITGAEGEKEIRGLAKLDVISMKTPFKPYQPISRGEFAAWLVRANNIIVGGQRRIRLARSGASTFADVAPGNPYWPYIQGLANAGYVVGFADGTFRPNQPLTREEMLFMKSYVDRAGVLPGNSENPKDLARFFSDWASVDPRFSAAIYWDDGQYSQVANRSRVFGSVKLLNPKASVTREEACICLWKFSNAATGDAKLKEARPKS